MQVARGLCSPAACKREGLITPCQPRQHPFTRSPACQINTARCRGSSIEHLTVQWPARPPRQRLPLPAAAAGSGGAASGDQQPSAPQSPSSQESALERAIDTWDATSSRLVDSATLPFVFLLLPQVILNAQNALGGNSQALAALSWVGYSMALAGNTLLLTYFIGKREASAVLIQALGVGSNFILLAQIFVAGFMPAASFGAAAVAVGAAAVVNGLKLLGLLDPLPGGSAAWALWSEVLGLVGLVILPQALWDTFSSANSTLPTAAAAGCASALFAAKRLGHLPQALVPLSTNLLGWTATLLFMFQPLAQLTLSTALPQLRNFAVPASLAGVSLGSVLLATAGNALMVPRALITEDAVWFAGSTWGAAFGWAQLLSLYLARNAAGEMYISHLTFAGLTTVGLGYAILVLSADARFKRLSFPFGPLKRLLSGGRSAAPSGGGGAGLILPTT